MDISEDIEYKRRVASVAEDRWALGGTVSVSGLSDTSETRERPKENLQIIPKREEISDRPRMKATIWEILCFFRVYTTAICKSQILTVREENINRFFVYRIIDLVTCSLSHVFVQIFLADYVPDAHFYLDKMSPLTCGYNFTVIITALFELVLFLNSNVLFMDYFWQGLFKKSPWKRCGSSLKFEDEGKKYRVNCYTYIQFLKKIHISNAQNKTLHFYKRAYYYEKIGTEDREYFQLSHVVHFWERIAEKNRSYEGSIFLFYIILICIIGSLYNKQLFKKFIWKILKFSHYTEVILNLLLLIFISMCNYEIKSEQLLPSITLNVSENHAVDIDNNYLAIVLNAPPVVQMLMSRNTKDHSEIVLNCLTTILLIFNWLYGMIITYNINNIKYFVESVSGVRIYISDMNSAGFFIFYPIFFSIYYMGNIWFAIFVLVKLLADFHTFMITHHCIVEAICCEWKFISRIFVNIGLTLSGLLIYMFVQYDHQVILYMYCKIVTIVVEVLGIYCLYPVSRLVEDMTFHQGTPPNAFQRLGLSSVSVFVLLKMAITVYQISMMFTSEEAKWFWLIPTVPIGLGMIYKVVAHGLVQKKPWSLLFVPVTDWGPADYITRHYRKIYKSDEYIDSQADRMLSRHMLSKTKSKVVHLDIRYDSHRRSAAPSMRYEDEKKNI